MMRLLFGAVAGYLAADWMAQRSAQQKGHAKLGGVFKHTPTAQLKEGRVPRYQTRYLAR